LVSSVPPPSSEGFENSTSVLRLLVVPIFGLDVKHVCHCIREQYSISGIFKIFLLLRGVGGSVEIWDDGESGEAILEVRHGKGIVLDLELTLLRQMNCTIHHFTDAIHYFYRDASSGSGKMR
jgi:hypothetical protein